MLLPTLLSTVTLALTANAFLLPPEVIDSKDATNHKDSFIGLNADKSVNLKCSACPLALAKERGSFLWTKGTPSDLVMNFSSDESHLLLNGVPFFPPSTNMIQALSAKQVVAPDDVKEEMKTYNGELGLSYSLDIQQPIRGPASEATLIPMIMQVIGIEGQMINVDRLNIMALKTTDGRLLLHSVETAKATVIPGAEKCTTIMCRVRAMIIAKLTALRAAAMNAAKKLGVAKGCHGKTGAASPYRGPHGHGPKVHGGIPKFQGKLQPHHGHHHGFHRFMHRAVRFFKAVLMPVLIGVAAGMAASAIGMIVAQIAVLLWMRYRRSSRGQYERVEQVETEAEDGLPKYEEVDSAEHVIDEKKELL